MIGEYQARGTKHTISVDCQGDLHVGLSREYVSKYAPSALYMSLVPADKRLLAADLIASSARDELPLMEDDALLAAIAGAKAVWDELLGAVIAGGIDDRAAITRLHAVSEHYQDLVELKRHHATVRREQDEQDERWEA